MIKLNEISSAKPEGISKKSIVKETDQMAREIADLSWQLFAENKRNILVVFQGMDSSGKDGATKNVFKYTSPSLVNAHSFKKPTDLEFAHDFLWRVHKLAPEQGKITVFNRSHYEDILIQRVHGWIDEDKVTKRINAINAFEQLLIDDNHTTILKFYMHLSKDRQKEKLLERIEVPRKNYKHNDGDWEQRKHWDKYMDAYEDAINRSTVPWIIAPVDSRWYRNYFITKKVLDCLKAMKLEWPVLEEKPNIDSNA